MVYREEVEYTDYNDYDDHDDDFTPALLRVNKLISAEATPRFYFINTFRFVRQLRFGSSHDGEASRLMIEW